MTGEEVNHRNWKEVEKWREFERYSWQQVIGVHDGEDSAIPNN